MDNIIDAEYLTPPPKEQPKPMTMSFFDALRKIQEGKMVTRISWANKDYCLMKDGFLSIFTKDAFHTWSINDGDMDGNDWMIITEAN